MPSSLNARSPSLFRVAGVLALLFVVSGGPSAGLAMLAGFDRWAMLSGALGAYIVLLLASQLPWFRGLVRDPAIASAISVVLRLRLITLPIGVGIDCIFGIASMWLAGYQPDSTIAGSDGLATRTLIATLCQCGFMLAAFSSAIWMLYPSQQVRAGRIQRNGLCKACGYDLRSTVGYCPECGEQVPAAHRPTQLDREVVLRIAAMGIRKRKRQEPTKAS